MINKETPFRNSLIGLLERNLITKDKIDKLYKDYQDIERAWLSNFEKNLNTVKLILISEAPQSFNDYIYNKDNDYKNTPFLTFNELKECLKKSNEEFLEFENIGKIKLMGKLGIVVLDIFPFPFSPTHKFNYKNQDHQTNKIIIKSKKHEELLRELHFKSRSWYLSEKIDKINTKISSNVVYAYRYKRNRDLDLDIYPGKEIDSFHSDGMHINTEKLYKVFKSPHNNINHNFIDNH
jgi:hypothetical protein